MEHRIKSSQENVRCTEFFSNSLSQYNGFKKVEYDYNTGSLKAAYDSKLLSNERALQIVNQAGREASMRIAQCVARNKHGEKDCANCVGPLAQQLSSQYESAATVTIANFSNNFLEVFLNTSREDIEVETDFIEAVAEKNKKRGLSIEQLEILFTVTNAVTGLLAFIGTKFGWEVSFIFALYFTSYATGGWFGLVASLKALKKKTINVDLLMLLAAFGAASIGQPAEGAMLLFLFSLSNTLQSFAMDRSRKAIEKLLDLRPAQATVRRGSRLVILPVEKLVLSDVVLVRPGERFPIA